MPVSIRSVSLEQHCDYGAAIEPKQRPQLELLVRMLEETPREAHAFVLERDSETLGTFCAVEMPGDYATVWPPILAPGTSMHDATLLVRHLNQALDHTTSVSLAQCLIEDITGQASAALRAEQFQPLAAISLMFCLDRHFPTQRPKSELEFVPAADELEQLADILGLTYQDSLDCPELGKLRTQQQLLNGYRATGTRQSQLWKLVKWEDRNVGCLIMADHPDEGASFLQLIYLGLLPAYRGRGWTAQLVCHAQWCARQLGRDRVLLSVDTRNRPALKHYDRSGFIQMATRNLLVRAKPNRV